MVCRDKALVEYTIAAIVGIHTTFKSLSVTPHVYSIADMSRWKAFFSCAVNFLADTTRRGLLHSAHLIVMPVFVACCFTTLNGTLLPQSLEVFEDGIAASVVCVPNTSLNLL